MSEKCWAAHSLIKSCTADDIELITEGGVQYDYGMAYSKDPKNLWKIYKFLIDKNLVNAKSLLSALLKDRLSELVNGVHELKSTDEYSIFLEKDKGIITNIYSDNLTLEQTIATFSRLSKKIVREDPTNE